MGLREMMTALKELEESIELPQKVASELGMNSRSVARAYLIAPGRARKLNDVPCFINWPDTAEDLGGFGTEAQESRHSIQIDFYGKPDPDAGAEMAAAFFDATYEALKAERPVGRRLKGSCDFLTLRGERPLIETLEWAGDGYPGFHLFLEVTLFERIEVA